MTRLEYMAALREKLESFNFSLQQEILDDYEQHFAEGLSAGKSEEEIIRELGDIDDMIQEFSEEERRQDLQVLEAFSEQTESYDCGYQGIEIDGLIANVELEKSEDGKLHVDYQNNGSEEMQKRYRFYQYEENNIFHVGVKDMGEEEGGKRIRLFGINVFSGISTGVMNGAIRLKIRIPEGFPQVLIQTVSGDVRIAEVNVAELSVQTVSGDTDLRHSHSGKLEVQTVSGDVWVEESAGSQVHAKTVSGELEWDNFSCDDFCLETISGDIQLNCGNCEKVAVTAVSGDVTADNVFGRMLSAKTTSGDVEIDSDFVSFYLTTASGDIGLRVCGNAREVCATTGSGDMDMNLEAVSTEVSAEVRSGECVVCNSSGMRHEVERGKCVVGQGDCKVKVKTGSGDIEIKVQ
ncbi:MAG: DUF4097 family beta strand repeat-containing protein [Acetatifactor sp.]